jgi:WD40 repeat protein
MSTHDDGPGRSAPLATLRRWFAPARQRIGARAPADATPAAVPRDPPPDEIRPPCLSPLDLEFAGTDFDVFGLRSEDLRHSPDGHRLAVVTTESKILLFALERSADGIRAELLTAFTSPDLEAPHGIDWVDDDHVVVANRRAGLAFFHLPRANRWEPETPLSAVARAQPHWLGAPNETRVLNARRIVTGAGSVRKFADHLYVSSNKADTVTRHRLLPGPTCDEGTLVAQEGISIPDSAVVSPDGVWLAVGDHNNARVLIFRLGESAPVAQLTDPALSHPHGLAFDPSGTVLVSADAGGRGLHLFSAPDGNWAVDRTSSHATTEGVAAPVFARVQSETPEAVRSLEGGTKGVDFSRDGLCVMTTCRGQTLRAFRFHAG